MHEHHVKIGENGRLVIPAVYRKALGIHSGDELILRIQDGELRIFQQKLALQRARQLIQHKKQGNLSATDDFLEFRKQDTSKE